MLFKIKSNPMHPLSGALPLPYVLARVTRGALVAHIGTRSCLLIVGLFSIAEPLCPSRCLFGTVLVTLCLMVFKSRANAFLLASSALSFLFPTVLSFSSFNGLVVWGLGLRTDRVFSLSPGLAHRTPI